MNKLPDIEKIEHVIWLQTAFIGDVVLTSAPMVLLKNKIPRISQWLIANPFGESLLRGQDYLQGSLRLDKKNGSFIKQSIKIKKYFLEKGLSSKNTVLLQAQRSVRSSLLCEFLGFSSIKFSESSLSFLASKTVSRIAVFHECARLAMLLEPFGFTRNEITSCRPKLKAKSEPSLDLKKYLDLMQKDSLLVGIAPGSVWATKRWPANKFSRLISLLLKQKNIRVVLIGSPNELEIAQKIEAEIHGLDAEKKSDLNLDHLQNFVGKTSLADLLHLFPYFNLLISNDSSPTHFGSAFNIPTLSIFGATTPSMGFAPLAKGSLSMQVSGLDCRPCSDHGPKVCPLKHFKCMEDLAVKKVYDSCLSMLKT